MERQNQSLLVNGANAPRQSSTIYRRDEISIIYYHRLQHHDSLDMDAEQIARNRIKRNGDTHSSDDWLNPHNVADLQIGVYGEEIKE